MYGVLQQLTVQVVFKLPNVCTLSFSFSCWVFCTVLINTSLLHLSEIKPILKESVKENTSNFI